MHTRDQGRQPVPETASPSPAHSPLGPDLPPLAHPDSAPATGTEPRTGDATPTPRPLPAAASGDTPRKPGLMGRIDLPGDVTSVAKARRYVRVLLANIAHPRTDDAVLLVSELVANAVRHSDSALPGGQVTVAVACCSGTLHIDVLDAGSPTTKPELRPTPDTLTCSGRGLWLVRELSSAWGWHETATGRVVWFQLPDA
ncbi:ATP-binding protein [Thermopolyspora sp. NPDC052614]|uniref:ATP-binding protein n=1 Tax=Thermopolyspora sp. NPDC052614 TaxID=3155682 RepID=UPI003415485C